MSDNPLPYPPEPIETERERIRRETATRFAAVMIAADAVIRKFNAVSVRVGSEGRL